MTTSRNATLLAKNINSSGTVLSAGGGTGLTSPGTSGNVLTSNGTSWVSQSLAAGISWVAASANVTAVDKQGVLANTSGGAFTVTLPATPTVGMQVVVVDSSSSWGTTPLTVARNGATIVGSATDLTMDIAGAFVSLVYSGTTWNVFTQAGGTGGTQAFNEQQFTPTALQTSFTITGGYSVGAIEVYLNGSLLTSGVDYTANNGSTVVLSYGAIVTDILVVRKWLPFSALGVPTGVIVGTTDTQTLTNKTLTAPVMSAARIYGSDAVYYNSNVTLVGDATNNPKLTFGSISGYRWSIRNKDVGGAGELVIRYEEGPTDVATFDRGGNVGVGGTPVSKLHLLGATGGYLQGLIVQKTGSNYCTFFADTNGTDAVVGTAGAIRFATYDGTAERGRFDSIGNLGVGVIPNTWSGYKAIQVNAQGALWSGSSGDTYLSANYVYTSGDKYIGTGQASVYRQYQGIHSWGSASASGTAGAAMSMSYNMALDATGNLAVGTPTASPNIRLYVVGTSIYAGYFNFVNTGQGIGVNNTSGGNAYPMYFFTQGTAVGNIYTTSSTTTYNTSSDYRLKNVTGPVTNSGAYIDALNPVVGNWKLDGAPFVGLIAHEAQSISKTQVATGEKDGEKMQAMDYSSPEIIANMIAELKALRLRVAALEITK